MAQRAKATDRSRSRRARLAQRVKPRSDVTHLVQHATANSERSRALADVPPKADGLCGCAADVGNLSCREVLRVHSDSIVVVALTVGLSRVYLPSNYAAAWMEGIVRSEYRQWPSERRESWAVPGGTAFAVYESFGGERVQNDDGTWTPREFTYVEMPSDAKLPYFVMECTYGDDLVPRILAFQSIQRDPLRDVRSADLRRIRLEDALEQAWLKVTRRPSVVVDRAMPADLLGQPTTPEKLKTIRGLRKQSRRRVTSTRHREVAEIYREHLDSGAPTKAVAEHFGIADSTASLYVREARNAGLLEPITSVYPKSRRAKQGHRRRSTSTTTTKDGAPSSKG
jgi:transposase-like protein